jgi:hypothetical protein
LSLATRKLPGTSKEVSSKKARLQKNTEGDDDSIDGSGILKRLFM